jgi:branched-chain amino acid transport system substrate-binding protein
VLTPARLAAWAALLVVFSGSACTSGPTKVVKIGVDLPLSGAAGRGGAATLNGVRFYVDHYPTLDGYTVVIESRDDAVGGRSDPQRGSRNIKDLAADPLVLGVIGPFDSSVARAAIPTANVADLALISPSASSRCLTKEPYLPAALSPSHTPITCSAAGQPAPKDLRPKGVNNFFRIAATDDLQGPAAADYAFKDLNLRRIAVLSDHEAYGQALAASFRSRFTQLGGLVVAIRDSDPTANLDLSAFMKAAKADGAQALYLGGVTANHACAIRAQMTPVFPAGDATPFLGGDGIAQDPACIRDAGANGAGIFATVPAANADSIATARSTISDFKRRFDKPGDYSPYTIAAYDATGVLYAALQAAIQAAPGQAPSRDGVLSALRSTTSYAGVLGTFGFDADGDSTLRVVSVYKSPGADPAAAWSESKAVDYSGALPY